MRKLSVRLMTLLALCILGLTLVSCVIEEPQKTDLDPVTNVKITDDANHKITFDEIKYAKSYLVELENEEGVVVFQKTIIESGENLGLLIDNEKLLEGVYHVYITAIASSTGNYFNSVRSLAGTFHVNKHILSDVTNLEISNELVASFEYEDSFKDYANFILTLNSPSSQITKEINEKQYDLASLITENGNYSLGIKVMPTIHSQLLLESNGVTKEFNYYNGQLPSPTNLRVDENFVVSFEYNDEVAKQCSSFVITLKTAENELFFSTNDLTFDLSEYVNEYGKYHVSVKAVGLDNCFGAANSDDTVFEFENINHVALLENTMKQYGKYQVTTDFKNGANYVFDLTIETDGLNAFVKYNDNDKEEVYYYFSLDGKYHLVKGVKRYWYDENYTYTYVQEIGDPILTVANFVSDFVWNDEQAAYTSLTTNILDVIGLNYLADSSLTSANLIINDDSSLKATTMFVGNNLVNKSTSTFKPLSSDYQVVIDDTIKDLVPVKLTLPADVVITYDSPQNQTITFTGVMGGYNYKLEVVNGDKKYTYTVTNYSSDDKVVSQTLFMNSTIKNWGTGVYDVYMIVEASTSNQEKYLTSDRAKVAEFVIPEINLIEPSNVEISDNLVLTFTDNNTVATLIYSFEVNVTLPDATTTSFNIGNSTSYDISKYISESGDYIFKVKAVSKGGDSNVNASGEVSYTFTYTAVDPVAALNNYIDSLNRYRISLTCKLSGYSKYDFTLESDGKTLYTTTYSYENETYKNYYYVQINGVYYQFEEIEYGSSYKYEYIKKLDDIPIMSLEQFKTLFTFVDGKYQSTDSTLLQIIGYGLFEESGIDVTDASFTLIPSGITGFAANLTGSTIASRFTATFRALTSDIRIPEGLDALIPTQLVVPDNWNFTIANSGNLAYSFTKILNAYKYTFEFEDENGNIVKTQTVDYVTGEGLKTGNMNGANRNFNPGTYKIYVTLSASSSNANKYTPSERTYVCDFVQNAVVLNAPTDFKVDVETNLITWTDTNSSDTSLRKYKITYLFSDGTTNYVFSTTSQYKLATLATAPAGQVILTIQAVRVNNEVYITESEVVTITYEAVDSGVTLDSKWVGTWEYEKGLDTFRIIINSNGTATYMYATGFTCTENSDGTLTLKGVRFGTDYQIVFKLNSSGQLVHVSGDSANPYTYTKA